MLIKKMWMNAQDKYRYNLSIVVWKSQRAVIWRLSKNASTQTQSQSVL